ncbi:unnamed protein product [Caenorhabditis angaria]|uniref:Uncharacterized protein n=1 Tax=Caenorhabditis angaria TaxID=860376 RepID=A0A9P1IDK4_9PELO|nr:unnamed protein product [Caenorhabditis angaria]
MLLRSSIFLIILAQTVFSGTNKLDLQNTGEPEEFDEDNPNEDPDDDPDKHMGKDVYSFLASRMKQDLNMKKPLAPQVYKIPGPLEPLPGRSHSGDYWPVFPFQNQYSGGVDLDPAISRHIGGDMNLAVPSWGMLDVYGRLYYRIHDTTTKMGYLNHPVNMMDLEKEDLVRLMSDPAVQANRNGHPTMPIGVFGKRYAPMSCKPPMCNPYHMNFGLGIEQDWGGADGVEGDIDVPMPISKGVAYRFPFSGNVYAARDNMTVTYGQNLSPIEPFSSLFDYQKHRDPGLRIPRKWDKRSVEEYPEEQRRYHKNNRHIISGTTQEFEEPVNYIRPYPSVQQIVEFNPFGFPLPIRPPINRRRRFMNPYLTHNPQPLFGCQIDSNLHGTYKKQSDRLMVAEKNPIIYEDVVITPTSISNFGDCYLKIGTSYIMGLMRMGKSVCFRCVTPIMMSPNIVQLAHQYEDTCYDTEREARMTCFDSTIVTISDGALLFRSVDEEAASCSPIDGRFNVAYRMNDAALSCENGEGTVSDNCQSSSTISIQFRNCSFPDFDMSLKCLGSWKDKKNQQYLIVKNEENEEYRCGLVIEDNNVKKLYFSNDSSCSSLSMKTAFDTYYFHSESHAKPFAPCSFPSWMQGEFDSMTISNHELQYLQHHVGAVPLISHCVQTFDDRVLVYTETKCGDPLGYHCLLFNARSQNLIEFKTSIPTESSNTSVCSNNTQWETVPWSSSVVLNTTPYPCGIFGSFSSPKDLDLDYCYDVSFSCEDPTKMNISAYHCNDGLIFDVRSYTCLASWKDNDKLLIYATREKDDKECFVSRYQDGNLYFAPTGDQCERNFDFEENNDKKHKQIMILKEKKSCQKVSFKSRKPIRIQGLPNHMNSGSTHLS